MYAPVSYTWIGDNSYYTTNRNTNRNRFPNPCPSNVITTVQNILAFGVTQQIVRAIAHRWLVLSLMVKRLVCVVLDPLTYQSLFPSLPLPLSSSPDPSCHSHSKHTIHATLCYMIPATTCYLLSPQPDTICHRLSLEPDMESRACVRPRVCVCVRGCLSDILCHRDR